MNSMGKIRYILISIPMALFLVLNVHAAVYLEEAEHTISAERLREHGKTVSSEKEELRVGLFPHATWGPSRVKLRISGPSYKMKSKLPRGFHFASAIYEYDVKRVGIATLADLSNKKVAFTAAYNPTVKKPLLHQWNQEKQSWKRLEGNPIKNKPWLATWTTSPSNIVAVLSTDPPPPQGDVRGPETRAGSMVIVDASGNEIGLKNADEIRPIASLTKIMTAMVLLDEGLNFNTELTYNEDQHYAFRNYLKLKEDEQNSVEDLWSSMLTASVNIAARMLVQSTNLTEVQFVERMNEKAKALGLQQTHFENVTGLSADLVDGQEDENVSTAREVAKMLQEAMKYPLIADALGRPFYRFKKNLSGKDEPHDFFHTDKRLRTAQPYRIIASKTGYTQEAGACFAQITKSAAGEFTIVSLGDDAYYQRFEVPKNLADWALLNSK